MTHHNGLVQAVVRQQVLGDLPFTEALQAGRIGLWRASLGYDPKRGAAFSTNPTSDPFYPFYTGLLLRNPNCSGATHFKNRVFGSWHG